MSFPGGISYCTPTTKGQSLLHVGLIFASWPALSSLSHHGGISLSQYYSHLSTLHMPAFCLKNLPMSLYRLARSPYLLSVS